MPGSRAGILHTSPSTLRLGLCSHPGMNEPPISPMPPAAPDFKDRRSGLKVFGVLQILFGFLAGLMVPLMLLGQIMAARLTQDAVPLRQTLQGMVVYLVIAAALVWVGIGSFRARRWSRALSLIISWSWLLTGVVTLVSMIFFLPSVLNAAQQPGQPMPEVMQMIVKLTMLAFIGFFFIAVPTGFVCFFQSRHVKATCEARDPVPDWTDACPLPVLALSLWLGFGALALLVMPVSANGVLPVFGQLISGPGGWLGCVVLAGVLGYSAWAIYRLRMAGWWSAVGFACLASASGFVTFSRVDLMDLYRLMGYGERQIEMMKQYPFMQGHWMAYLSLAGTAVMLAYLLFVRRYFRHQAEAVSQP
jgi:hypothetical protein